MTDSVSHSMYCAGKDTLYMGYNNMIIRTIALRLFILLVVLRCSFKFDRSKFCSNFKNTGSVCMCDPI